MQEMIDTKIALVDIEETLIISIKNERQFNARLVDKLRAEGYHQVFLFTKRCKLSQSRIIETKVPIDHFFYTNYIRQSLQETLKIPVLVSTLLDHHKTLNPNEYFLMELKPFEELAAKVVNEINSRSRLSTSNPSSELVQYFEHCENEAKLTLFKDDKNLNSREEQYSDLISFIMRSRKIEPGDPKKICVDYYDDIEWYLAQVNQANANSNLGHHLRTFKVNQGTITDVTKRTSSFSDFELQQMILEHLMIESLKDPDAKDAVRSLIQARVDKGEMPTLKQSRLTRKNEVILQCLRSNKIDIQAQGRLRSGGGYGPFVSLYEYNISQAMEELESYLINSDELFDHLEQLITNESLSEKHLHVLSTVLNNILSAINSSKIINLEALASLISKKPLILSQETDPLRDFFEWLTTKFLGKLKDNLKSVEKPKIKWQMYTESEEHYHAQLAAMQEFLELKLIFIEAYYHLKSDRVDGFDYEGSIFLHLKEFIATKNQLNQLNPFPILRMNNASENLDNMAVQVLSSGKLDIDLQQYNKIVTLYIPSMNYPIAHSQECVAKFSNWVSEKVSEIDKRSVALLKLDTNILTGDQSDKFRDNVIAVFVKHKIRDVYLITDINMSENEIKKVSLLVEHLMRKGLNIHGVISDLEPAESIDIYLRNSIKSGVGIPPEKLTASLKEFIRNVTAAISESLQNLLLKKYHSRFIDFSFSTLYEKSKKALNDNKDASTLYDNYSVNRYILSLLSELRGYGKGTLGILYEMFTAAHLRNPFFNHVVVISDSAEDLVAVREAHYKFTSEKECVVTNAGKLERVVKKFAATRGILLTTIDSKKSNYFEQASDARLAGRVSSRGDDQGPPLVEVSLN